jgi:hypothetical protein
MADDWETFAKVHSGEVLELKIQEPKKDSANSKLEDSFASQLLMAKAPPFVRHFKFAKQIGRQWAFDFAFTWPNNFQVAVEIEGLSMRRDKDGQWQMGGRHGSIGGFEEDCVKYNTAALLGWTVLRFTGSQVRAKSGYAVALTQRVLYAKGWRPTP